MTVVILEDVAEDMEAGRRFYESRESGIGDYFVESILSDLDSLVLYAGIHRLHLGFHRMLSKRFPFGIYYELSARLRMFTRSSTCAVTLFGFVVSCRGEGSEQCAGPNSRERLEFHAVGPLSGGPTQPIMTSNPALALWLQSVRRAGRVAELGSLAGTNLSRPAICEGD